MLNSKTTPLLQSYRGKPARWNPYFITKRVVDVTASLVLLIVLFPLLLVITLLIVLDSPGNPIFLQERIGRRGRSFKIIKFRTMSAHRDDRNDRAFMQAFVAKGEDNGNTSGTDVKINKPNNQNDYTRIGRILRRTSLDELPQIINILKGEMSLVGPRPNVPWEVEMYKLWHQARLDVLPGITGLAQVEGRSSLSFNEIVRNDINYVMKYSILLDVKILWKTIFNSLNGHGAG